MDKKERIARILEGDAEHPNDHSLQTKARRRAEQGTLPRTMTPWEWEEWYALHGIPEAHHPAESAPSSPTIWQRLLNKLKSP